MLLSVYVCSILVSVSAVAGTGNVHLLIYETDIDLKSILSEQAAIIPGITSTVVGRGTKFEGFGSKYEAVIPELRRLDSDTLVVVSDARDVIINDPVNSLYSQEGAVSVAVQEFYGAFEALTSLYPGAIVVSAEAQCCVGALTYAKPGDYITESGQRNERACYSGKDSCLWNGNDKAEPWDNFMKDLSMQRMGHGEDVYLNAGLIAGKAGDMLRVFETADFQVFEDDQAVLTDFMYRRPDELILDYNQAIFGNNRHSTNGCMFLRERSDARLIHSETETTPFFIHSPGGYVSCHENLANRLGVELTGVEQRRKLQDWKREMQNYAPVCDYKCPANSVVTQNTKCLDSFNDCQCNLGFTADPISQSCIRDDVPVCNYVCPPNSVEKPNTECRDTFNDCQCNAGFLANSVLEVCRSCNYVCPPNSNPKPNIQCRDDFNDCQCRSGFIANRALQVCTSCSTYTCPANSSRRPGILCYDSFDDCQCNRGFVSNPRLKQCTNCNTYTCPANSRPRANVQCRDTFTDCQCNFGFRTDPRRRRCVSIF